MTPPFLSVFTPTYQRPRLLEQCVASVAAQTEPVDHVVVHDTAGVGIAGVYATLIPENRHLPVGDYVMVLSDDNVLNDPDFAADLRRFTGGRSDLVDVIMFRGLIEGTVQPIAWRRRPELLRVDLSCFAVRRSLWREHAFSWGHRYEGDYDFISTLWDQGARFSWFPRIGFRALQISRGAPETP